MVAANESERVLVLSPVAIMENRRAGNVGCISPYLDLAWNDADFAD
jgi:hypothetical protein